MVEIEYLFNATSNKKKFINNMVKLLKKEELHIIDSSFDSGNYWNSNLFFNKIP